MALLKNINLLHFLIILFGLITVTIFSITLKNKFATPYKKENFTHLVMSLDPSCSMTEGCDNESYQLESSQASGLAFKSIGKKTFILSAAHFCEEFVDFSVDYDNKLIHVGSTLNVYDYNGNKFEGNVIYQDSKVDLCLITSDMPISEEIGISASMPLMGEDIYSISAPLGIGPPGVALHFSGKFSGCDTTGDCFFSMPAAFGSSGSIIVNQDGEMIAMVQKALVMFNVISIGKGSYEIKEFLEDASNYLNINLL